MRKPLAKCTAIAPVRGLGVAIKPSPFRSRGLAQETATLAPLPASEPSKPPFNLRLRPAELSHMKGTIHPNPPAQHLPFQGEAGRGFESPYFTVSPPNVRGIAPDIFESQLPQSTPFPLWTLPRRKRGMRARKTLAPAPPPILPHQGGGAGPVVVEKGCLPICDGPAT